MAWRANAAAGGGAGAAAARVATATPTKNAGVGRGKPTPTMQAIAEIERNREDRRRAMARAKKERERESLENEKKGCPGDVDFQRMIRNFREQNGDKKQPHATPGETQITICVRKRPVNEKEVKKHDYDSVTCLNPMVVVHDCKLKVDGITKFLESNAFSYDHTFDENTSNETVYQYTAQPLVKFVFQDRGRATVFAYGQTGSGKTHTMQGIQEHVAEDVFKLLGQYEAQGVLLDACASFFEIYGGRCQDLLHHRRCTIREDAKGQVQVVDLEEVTTTCVEDLLEVIAVGNSQRTTHATEVNDVSSRSHCICQITIRYRGSDKLFGQLSLIDLAGSERGEDTKNHNRQRRMESSEINKSLLALKECFRAMDTGGNTHIPFRASKLTQVLKDSFVNTKARTVMIATVSPCASNSHHTVNTLRYADRVKEKHVASDAFDGSVPVNADDVQLYSDEEIRSPSSPMRGDMVDSQDMHGIQDMHDMQDLHDDIQDLHDVHDLHDAQDAHDSDAIEEEDLDEQHPEDDRRRLYRSNSVSSQEDIKMLHDSLRRQSQGSSVDLENDYDLEALHGAVQTLYEEEENLLDAHMNAIQEDAQLLTEEGSLLAEIQGDHVVDYDIDRYVSRLTEIFAQKAATVAKMQKLLATFRQRCAEEEDASRKVKEVAQY